MPVPIVMPQPGIPSPAVAAPDVQASNDSTPGTAQHAASTKAPSRSPSPTRDDVATTSVAWRIHTLPLYARLTEVLFEGEDNSLPSQTTGCIGFLKLDGYSARDTTENMCCLIKFLQDHTWEMQVVSTFVDTMRTKSHWPTKLASASPEEHAKYVWSMMEGLLGIFAYNDYLKPVSPRTVHDIVPRIFSELPLTTASRFLRIPRPVIKPRRFSFSVRDLLDEEFMIEPTSNLADHLKMNGNAIRMYVLDAAAVKFLMAYHKNRVAKAIGMANLGNEVLQSYAVLTQIEFQENFKLPIQLGMFKPDPDNTRRTGFDDLVVITGVIRLFHNHPDFDPQPHLLAERVRLIEAALATRRHWYRRLRRDIHKRKKEEPWLFWGAVLAFLFGICTVIQTITSVWSLVLATA
ncbi:hypothetical protein L227DRAFT_579044 [Lentinus tigrinus ALCF2SS1-6]|uniref:Uncharacterized protein n=2 Tax=Lentinus tigrinus TaxID=5365 RepID=A0A5C2RZ10_9APHY|nr:hypothetical protein L227DRAFT_579044 [Lentinus tigrinus ALCF2SS1-6]